MASSPITSWQIEGEQVEAVTDFILLGSKITADGDCSHESKRHLLLERKAMTNLDSMLKSRDHFADKGPSSQSYGFSGSHVWMWELDHKKGWVLRNWCFQFVVLEKTLESPLSSKEIKPDNPKGNQPRLKLKLQYIGHLMWRADSLEKSLMWGKIEGRRRRGRQDEMVRWHHWLDGHESEQAPGVADEEGSLGAAVHGVTKNPLKLSN